VDPVRRFPVTRVGRDRSDDLDLVAVEEPLEIRVGEKPIAVTMRTPGDDFELAAGFLFTENIVLERAMIEGIRHWGSPNVVRVALREGARVDLEKIHRHFYATSSCGICGKSSIDAVRVKTMPVSTAASIEAELLNAMPETLKASQSRFAETGGLHAAALFSTDGQLLLAREDVGRHNAVDKVIGSRFLDSTLPLDSCVLFVSGRAGFEIVQKAIVAGIGIIAAVGAPSSLAVDIATEMGATLVGFVRDGRFNVYSGAQRIR
jgi:FdhD protein